MHSELIERLVQATGPDLDLDHAIAAAVLPADGHGVLLYTGSIDAALTLVPDGWAWRTVSRIGPFATGKPCRPRAELAEPIQTDYGPGVCIRAQEYGATPALTICAAALKVMSEISATPEQEM